MTINNFILNGELSMELMKGNLFNEEMRSKTYDTEKV